jgi:hypothetical protein
MSHSNELGEVIRKAWEDETFKKNLLEKPEETLKNYGIEIPEGFKVYIHENDENSLHIVLPPKPDFNVINSNVNSIDVRCNLSCAGDNSW